ncbi:MAG: hypothetical protein KGL69_13375, partial [Alphaproteobacteria bacterium]|nr:hypothetical protein [Alphaproteobacteria bacterium]
MDSAAHRVPNELCVSETPIRRVLVIGSCLTAGYAIAVPNLSPGTLADHILVNNFATLPAAPPAPFADYDFQVIQLPIRSILPDHAMFRTPPEIKAWEQVFEDCCNRMTQMLDTCLQWSREQGLLTFVYNFMTPQQSAMGRTFPRYDLRNPIHFIERLNQRLAEAISDVPNVHLFDIDSIAATIGRRYVQDDVIAITNHGATVGDDEFLNHDQARLELPERPTRVFDQRGWEFLQTIWAELRALYRTCRQADQVKLVLIDLDDTLWRGVLAETDQTNIEGWPLGFAEALMFLKRRGMILGIVSKNSQERVEELWRRHIG